MCHSWVLHKHANWSKSDIQQQIGWVLGNQISNIPIFITLYNEKLSTQGKVEKLINSSLCFRHHKCRRFHSKPTILQPFQIIWENIKICGEFKTDQDRLKSDRHGGHGKAKECQRWIEVGHGVKKSRRFFVSKLPEDHIDLRGGTHSQASAPLYLVLPRIGMILVWKIRSSSTCLVF